MTPGTNIELSEHSHSCRFRRWKLEGRINGILRWCLVYRTKQKRWITESKFQICCGSKTQTWGNHAFSTDQYVKDYIDFYGLCCVDVCHMIGTKKLILKSEKWKLPQREWLLSIYLSICSFRCVIIFSPPTFRL